MFENHRITAPCAAPANVDRQGFKAHVANDREVPGFPCLCVRVRVEGWQRAQRLSRRMAMEIAVVEAKALELKKSSDNAHAKIRRQSTRSILKCFLLLSINIMAMPGARAVELEAVSFADKTEPWFLPIKEIAEHLHWRLKMNERGECIALNNYIIPRNALRFMNDGTELAPPTLAARAGATVSSSGTSTRITVRSGWQWFSVIVPTKRVEVRLDHQDLQAWQGNRLVLSSNISSGRGGSTPAGEFRAGPFKAPMHYSSRYHHAPMPWSVQINGHIFIHGFSTVPDYPASHGCIRLPLTGRNPARCFYEWVETGTLVRIRNGTSPPSTALTKY